MRKRKKGKKFGRSTAHRRALYRNVVQSLFEHEKITTTLAKAKVIKPLAEKLITKAKKGGLHNRRQIEAFLYKKEIADKVVESLSPRFKDRPGGYIRIIKLGERAGDGAEMAKIELVEEKQEKQS